MQSQQLNDKKKSWKMGSTRRLKIGYGKTLRMFRKPLSLNDT